MAANAAVRAAEPFSDLSNVLRVVGYLKVADLKALIKDVNGRKPPREHLSLSGLKAQLISRVQKYFEGCSERNDVVNYETGRRDLERHYGSPIVQGSVRPPPRPYGQAQGYQAGNYTLGGVPSNKFSSSPSVGNSAYNGLNSRAGAAGIHGHQNGTSASGNFQQAARPANSITNFKSTPFLQPKEWIVGPVTAYEAPGPNERKHTWFYISLKAEQIALLEQKDHQLRLFSTPRLAWDLGQNPNQPASIEFPLFCEVSVNKVRLSLNLKGGKKGPAKVLPPNLNKDKALALAPIRMNHIEMTYGNAPKAFVLAVAICSVVDSAALVTALRAKHLKPKDVVLSNMKRAADDDDVEVGEASLSLKCPLSYMRLQTPCRSEACDHVQCFDALSFYSINEQTPSWQCPICFRSIDPSSLFWDGYVQDILDRVPEEEETVLTDALGNWRTSNSKVTSANSSSSTSQQASNAQVGSGEASGSATPMQSDFPPTSNGGGEGSNKRKHSEVFEILDDDEDDNDELPERSRSRLIQDERENEAQPDSTSNQPPSGGNSAQVIDLTLSDSDEEDVPTPPLPRSAGLLSTIPSNVSAPRQYPISPSSLSVRTIGETGHADRRLAQAPSNSSVKSRPHFNPLELLATTKSPASAQATVEDPGVRTEHWNTQGAHKAADGSNEQPSSTNLYRPRTPPREGGDSDEEEGQLHTPPRTMRQVPPWSRWDEEDESFDDGDDRLFFDARAGLGGGPTPVGHIASSSTEH